MDKSGCEIIKCQYASRDENGEPVCLDERGFVNENGDLVCGMRADAILVEEDGGD